MNKDDKQPSEPCGPALSPKQIIEILLYFVGDDSRLCRSIVKQSPELANRLLTLLEVEDRFFDYLTDVEVIEAALDYIEA